MVLGGIALGVFMAKPMEVSQQTVFNKPKININFEIFESEQFKNLEPFTKLELQFSYKALTENNKIVEGKILAPSAEEARKKLQAMDLTPQEIKEVKPGRDNPFEPYYKLFPAPVVKKK